MKSDRGVKSDLLMGTFCPLPVPPRSQWRPLPFHTQPVPRHISLRPGWAHLTSAKLFGSSG